MRSHVTCIRDSIPSGKLLFQYRKRYEITCDECAWSPCLARSSFNTASGMRSHVTRKCKANLQALGSFNTASGMRSHVTRRCSLHQHRSRLVSIPQAVWDHMWRFPRLCWGIGSRVSIPQAVWDHMWLVQDISGDYVEVSGFNTASGMRSHVTYHR